MIKYGSVRKGGWKGIDLKNRKKFQKFLLFLLVAVAGSTGCAAKNGQTGLPVTATPTPVSATKLEKEEKISGYVFEYQGVSMTMDMEAAGVIEALGEPVSYFEAPSCAFEGLDKIYNYGSFELDTYEKNGMDYISGIYFRDDLIGTREGISLYMSYDELVEVYGQTEGKDSGTVMYEKDGMKLCFLVKEGKIISIEYRSGVLD